MTDIALLNWAMSMRAFMTSGDRKFLPKGVTFKSMRHHGEPCPLEGAKKEDHK